MSNHIRAPRSFSFAAAESPEAVLLSWQSVEDADHYEVRGGGTNLIRRVDGIETTIRGLLPSHSVQVQVRAVGDGQVSEWATMQVRPTTPIPTAPDNGSIIPLIDTDRQSLILRLPDSTGANIDIRLSIWWSPSDSGWWGSIEAPINTQAVSSRRLGLNCGLLDSIYNVLDGNIVMRATGEFVQDEPTRASLVSGEHILRWEPNS